MMGALTVFTVLLASAALTGRAQVASMSLMGNVQSDDRRALPGAAITVVHVPSGTRYATAANATGRFTIHNLMAGGPYLVQVGESGYRPQTLESIFLEKGKIATFTVTLSKMDGGPGKGRAGRSHDGPGSRETLAAESVVGEPVLLTTAPTSTPTATQAPDTASGPPVDAATAPPAPAAEPPAAPRYQRNYTYQPRPTKAVVATVPGHYDAKRGNYIYETGEPVTLRLPSGEVIKQVGIHSTESKLHHFITDPQTAVDTVDLTQGWYNFDRVFFDPGKATLTPESVGQLRNIAKILRAFPKSRIKLGGYTDSTGTYKVNKQLSDARARTAWARLVDMGVSPSRIEARGYGPRYAIAPNATEVGRSMNRRLSVKVLQK